MTVEYFHTSVDILTDDLYTMYGGRTGTSTPAQRQAAYQIAETMMIRELGTFLLPTTVTGTFEFGYPWPTRYRLPHHHLISIDAVTILSRESYCNCDLKEDDGCAYIVDSKYGFIDVKAISNAAISGCGCTTLNLPYQARIAYTAGLPTGVAANDAALHQALTIVAEIALLEIVDPAAHEGGPGDIGVQEYVSMGYGEKRFPLRDTALGNSPRANRAWRLVRHLDPHVVGKMGR